jgi:hypothetical protein
MLQIQVMYIIFQLYSKTQKITSVNNYSDEIKFGTNSSIKPTLIDDSAEIVM